MSPIRPTEEELLDALARSSSVIQSMEKTSIRILNAMIGLAKSHDLNQQATIEHTKLVRLYLDRLGELLERRRRWWQR